MFRQALNFLICLLRMLVGEGARRWAQSKHVILPETVAEADQVQISPFSIFTLNHFTWRIICLVYSYVGNSGWLQREQETSGESLRVCFQR